MQVVGGLEYIIIDHFKPYRVETNKNRFEALHTLFVAVIPIACAVAIGYYASLFVSANSGTVIAVYAIMASVMTAIMPTINGLIGTVDRNRIEALQESSRTCDDNISEARNMVAKVEVVRELYAAVAWSVIVLCMALVPLLLISHSAFQADIKNPPTDIGATLRYIRMGLVGVIGFAGCVSLVALIQIVSGVHLMLRHGQVDIEKNVKKLSDRFGL